jgi:16S rRNA (guanine966-N2)-methyltransferase
VRPTTDIAREALFNLLRSRIDLESANVIDLFSGTGFVSYEFCSRGALSVVAVEQNPKCAAFIRQTAELLGMTTLTVVRTDVFRFLKKPNRPADLIFADPPYDLSVINEIPDLILSSGILAPEGLLVMEHGPSQSFSAHAQHIETRNYGKVHFTFFRPSTKSTATTGEQ